jgi:CRP/FNR family cyclic AMP-dependent transcriptional regulator
MTIRAEDLSNLPLFRDMSKEQLDTFVGALAREIHPAGEVLFRAGDVPTHFLLLVRGEVTLKEEGDERFRLLPVAPIGELGTLTGLPRTTEGVITAESEIWSIEIATLMQLFERQGDLGFRFYRNLLGMVSGKVRHDRRRMDEMRWNLIRTQKRMKAIRELVLSSRETEISKNVYEALDELIERNRRAHYRVTPSPSLSSSVRMDDGTLVRVLELSDGYLKLQLPAEVWPKDREWAAVLVLPAAEIFVSGRVIRAGADGVVMKLDLLIDEYKVALEDYVTSLQMLDVVV